MSDIQYAGQVALVTGASRGIGRAIATALAERGVKVIGTATTESAAQAITEALASKHRAALVVRSLPRWLSAA